MLTDGHITLKAVSPADAQDLAEAGNNPKIALNMRDVFPCPYTLQHAENFIKTQQGKTPQQVFGIYYNGHIIGCTGIFPQDDVYRFGAELGYWVSEPHWGKGLATRAVMLMAPYGFETFKLNRIYADVFSFNPASMRVLEKCGFVFEGIFKKAVLKKDTFYDAHRYALVR